MCDYQGQDFGANYLDSVCCNGYLWDADSGGPSEDGSWLYDNGGEIPCPECNHQEWLDYFKDSFMDEGYDEAAEGRPRTPPDLKGKLKYPEDEPQLTVWWLEGYDLHNPVIK